MPEYDILSKIRSGRYMDFKQVYLLILLGLSFGLFQIRNFYNVFHTIMTSEVASIFCICHVIFR